MSRDFTDELLADLEDIDSLALTLVMAEALNRRGESGPLARPWVATGRRARISKGEATIKPGRTPGEED